MKPTQAQIRKGVGYTRLLFVVVMIAFSAFFVVQALASGPTVIQSQEATPTASPFISTPTPTDTLALTSPSLHQVTLRALGSDDIVLSGPWGTAEFLFQLPANWLIHDGSYMDLVISFTSTEIGKFEDVSLGQLSVFLDNKPVWIYSLNETTIEQRTLHIPLSSDSFNQQETWHKIRLILDTRLLCGVPHNAQLNVHAHSSLALYYTLTPLVPDLAALPRPFYQRSFTPESVRFVLPEQPDDEELRDAAIVAAKLGSLTDNRLVISATTDVDWLAMADRSAPMAEHLVVIGRPERNRLIPWLNERGILPVTIERRALALSLTGPLSASAGQILSYTVTVTNTDGKPSSSIDVEYRFGHYARFSACTPQCQVQDRRVVWTLEALSAGQVASMTVELEVDRLQTVPDQPVWLESMAVLTGKASAMLNVCSFSTAVSSTEAAALWATQIAQGGHFFVQNGQAVVPGDGVLMEIVSPWDAQKAILLVTGDSPEAVAKAAQALGTQNSIPQVRGPVALVRQINPSEESLSSAKPTRFTFADLGYGDRTISGPFPYSQGMDYWFTVPLNWRVDNRALLELHFSHSEAIQENSSLSVSLGKTPLATIVLDKNNARNGVAMIPLPISGGLKGQRIRIALQASMYLERDACQEVDFNQAWINIAQDSWIDLGNLVDPTTEIDLKHLPFPFNNRVNLGDVTFVLSATPGPADREALLRLAAAMGNMVGRGRVNPQVVLGRPSEDEFLNRRHLIVIGRPTANALLAELNPFLPQPFLPGADSIEPRIGEVSFRLPDNLSLGLIQELRSPWNPERAILVITGTDDQGLLWAVQAIARQAWALKGNLALVRGKEQGLEIQALDTRRLTSSGVAAAVATAVPSLTPVPSPTPQPTQAGDHPTPTPIVTSTQTGLPLWVIGFAGSAIIVSVAILGVALWRLRK